MIVRAGSRLSSAHEFCAQLFRAAPILSALFGDVAAEGRHVLMQLAIHHESTVASQQMRIGRGRKLAGFIRVTQQDFPCGERLPIAVFIELALARSAAPLRALEIRVSEAIFVAGVCPRWTSSCLACGE